MIDLRCVTLVCFENRDHRRALSLINGMCTIANFGDIRWMNQHKDYDGFIYAEFTAHTTVRTTHMLYVHLDGYILRPDLWDPKWLEFDYIGAPWPAKLLANRWPETCRVGNGGFSLRTVKLAKASHHLGFQDVNNDVLVCCVQRWQLEAKGLQFAPIEEAAKFSTELPCPETQPESFGFHKYGHPHWK